MNRASWVLVTTGLLILLTGCSEPYEKEIPASGFLTAGEAESVARRLDDSDKELFRRWAARAPTSERFPGEAIPNNVRSALINQTRFEVLQAEKAAKDAERVANEKKAAEEKRKQQEQDQLAYEQIKKADEVIKKYFIATPTTYEIVPVFNSYGALSYREWRFNVRLTNRTPKNVIGMSGLVLVKDAFGEEIDLYDFRVEPQVAPGRAIDYTLTMRHEPKDPRHMAMLNTESLFFEWLFDSLAFSDGTKLDYNSVSEFGDLHDTADMKTSWP